MFETLFCPQATCFLENASTLLAFRVVKEVGQLFPPPVALDRFCAAYGMGNKSSKCEFLAHASLDKGEAVFFFVC